MLSLASFVLLGDVTTNSRWASSSEAVGSGVLQPAGANLKGMVVLFSEILQCNG
jgi:hypothetical protein